MQSLSNCIEQNGAGLNDGANWNYPMHYWEPWQPAPIYWPGIMTYVIGSPHRACSCPNCKGDCCDCADCKVRRLEKRVAELEAAKE